MNQICAVVDAQGFAFKDRFVAREVAICSDYMSMCMELNPYMYWRELPDEEQSIVMHSTKYKHGLHFMPFNPRECAFLPHSDQLGLIIKQWYELVKEEEKPFIAFKNQALGRVIEQLDIPSIDLDKVEFPSLNELKTKYGYNYLCAYHKKPFNRFDLMCAYRKCNHIYREIKEMQ